MVGRHLCWTLLGHLAFKLFKEAYGNHYLFAGLGESIPFPRLQQ